MFVLQRGMCYCCHLHVTNLTKTCLYFITLQPVGFVTFSSRVAAEAAKQDLQVGSMLDCLVFESTSVIQKVLSLSMKEAVQENAFVQVADYNLL